MTPKREKEAEAYLDAIRLLFPSAAEALEILTDRVATLTQDLAMCRALANNAEAKLRRGQRV